MSEHKFTPGPWFISDYYHDVVVDQDGLRIAAALSDKPIDVYDAHLIAAAPRLLQALQEVVRISDRQHDAWDEAKAAIAEALGEAE